MYGSGEALSESMRCTRHRRRRHSVGAEEAVTSRCHTSPEGDSDDGDVKRRDRGERDDDDVSVNLMSVNLMSDDDVSVGASI
jgi:hypothetical protein